MQVPKQLPRTLVALVVTYVLASVIEAVNLVSAARVGLEMGIVEVPYLPADSAFDYRKRLQPGHLMLERLEAQAGCLESPEIDEVLARVLRNTFVGASVRS
jgi:hypothetical protein